MDLKNKPRPLKQARQEQGYTQQALAHVIKINTSQLNRIEKGRQIPTRQTRHRLTCVLNDIDWLTSLKVPVKHSRKSKAIHDIEVELLNWLSDLRYNCDEFDQLQVLTRAVMFLEKQIENVEEEFVRSETHKELTEQQISHN